MNDSENKYLIFSTYGKDLMISFADVLMIIPAAEPERIPDFPDYALGTIVSGGNPVTVISLRKRFGYPDKPINGRDCIIICDGAKHIGLLCDNISGFVQTLPDEILPPPDINEQANARFISGTYIKDEKPYYIIKPELIIRPEDEEKFQENT